jgi:hypothetical protein
MLLAMKIIASLVLLAVAWGYQWQANDREEFPDDELPAWFVKWFRR